MPPFAATPPAMLQVNYHPPPTTDDDDDMDSPTDSLSSLSLGAEASNSYPRLLPTAKKLQGMKLARPDLTPRSSTDPSPSSLMQGYFAHQPAGPTSSHRNRSPYNRSHLRSRSGNAALLSAPAMTRAHSLPNPHISRSALAESSTVTVTVTSSGAVSPGAPPPSAPRSPMRTPARVRSPFREDG
ncbi:hypothetical protein B0A55_06614, partial [Friedmanniomyces simplex]